MKKSLIAIAVAMLAVSSGAASAAESKHRTAAPARHHGHHGPHGLHLARHPHAAHRHSHGYWHHGRWVAPVALGATLGAVAISASTPTYVAPAPIYSGETVNYYSPGDRFSWADVNNDGYLSYYESRRYGNLHRNFAQIDWNGDGYLSRNEVEHWRHDW